MTADGRPEAWRTKGDFEAWTKSEAFRAAHARACQGKPLTLGHLEFEGLESVLELLPKVQAA
jgi:heme-degrading monooxygenase HmoA